MIGAATIEPHPPTRHCMCRDCAPSFEPSADAAALAWRASMRAVSGGGRPAGRAANMAELMALREGALQRSTGKHGISAAAIEWVGLALELRMCILLVAGIDGDLASLARRSWGEFTPPECTAVQVATRAMIRQLGGVFALTQK